MNLFAHPFRFQAGGGVFKLDPDSDAYHAQQIATLLLTGPGERPLVPAFGVADAAFQGVQLPILQGAASQFEVDATITDITVSVVSDSVEQLNVEFA